MKGILNYRVHFMDGQMIYITSEEAAEIESAWGNGRAFINLRGNSYACHQIIKIERDRRMEADELLRVGIVVDPQCLGYDRKKALDFQRKNGRLLGFGGKSAVGNPNLEAGLDDDLKLLE